MSLRLFVFQYVPQCFFSASICLILQSNGVAREVPPATLCEPVLGIGVGLWVADFDTGRLEEPSGAAVANAASFGRALDLTTLLRVILHVRHAFQASETGAAQADDPA